MNGFGKPVQKTLPQCATKAAVMWGRRKKSVRHLSDKLLSVSHTGKESIVNPNTFFDRHSHININVGISDD